MSTSRNSASGTDPLIAARNTLSTGLLTGVWLVAVVVLSRRVSGDLEPLPRAWQAGGVGALLLVVNACSVAIHARGFKRWRRFGDRFLMHSLAALPPVITGLVLLPPGGATGMVVLIGFGLLASLANAGMDDLTQVIAGFADRGRLPASSAPQHQADRSDPYALADPSDPLTDRPVDDLPAQAGLTTDDDLEESLPHPSLRPETTQWMSRSRLDNGESIEGSIRVALDAGQHQAIVHIPFAPAFASQPDFECEILDDTDARLRSTVHSYGVRIEVTRRDSIDQPALIEIGWMACSEYSGEARAA